MKIFIIDIAGVKFVCVSTDEATAMQNAIEFNQVPNAVAEVCETAEVEDTLVLQINYV